MCPHLHTQCNGTPNRDHTSSLSPAAKVTLTIFFGITSKERPALLWVFALR